MNLASILAMPDGVAKTAALVAWVENYEILMLAPENRIAERLAVWQHSRSSIDGVNAWLVHNAMGATLDQRRLSRQATARDSKDALTALRRLSRRASNREVTADEVERWALQGP